jgi:hypothetical protein
VPPAKCGAANIAVGCDHFGVDAPAGPAWSSAVSEADWIAERLSPFDAHQVTSVIPSGFGGEALITTSRGTVRAWLSPLPIRRGTLRTSTVGDNGVNGSGEVSLSYRGQDELRDEISLYLTFEVIGLAGG